MTILVSACLLGLPCRYDGRSVPCPALVKAADAPRLSVSTRAVNLEEIMVHLEKEAE